MARKKGFGVSPITNTIYYGTQDTEKHMWVGEKKDVTSEVIASVFEWFMGNMDGKQEYSISYPSMDFELVMRIKGGGVDEIVGKWCPKIGDSPDTELERNCEYYKTMTNADCIRSMTDEELKDFLCMVGGEDYMVWNGERWLDKDDELLEWLQSESEE